MSQPKQPEITLEEAQAKVETLHAPRVSKEAIEARIRDVEYVRPFEVYKQMTLCAICMDNDFVVVGKAVPASAENFDPEIGERYAYEDAFRQLWALEAYLLREKLSGRG